MLSVRAYGQYAFGRSWPAASALPWEKNKTSSSGAEPQVGASRVLPLLPSLLESWTQLLPAPPSPQLRPRHLCIRKMVEQREELSGTSCYPADQFPARVSGPEGPALGVFTQGSVQARAPHVAGFMLTIA